MWGYEGVGSTIMVWSGCLRGWPDVVGELGSDSGFVMLELAGCGGGGGGQRQDEAVCKRWPLAVRLP